MADKHPGGRPTDYTADLVQAARDYLINYKSKHKHTIPSVVGLCKVINLARSTIYDWCDINSPRYQEEFSDIIEQINEYQEFDLVDGGLKNELNPTITKLLLHKHGHHDKSEVEATIDDTRELSDLERAARINAILDEARNRRAGQPDNE